MTIAALGRTWRLLGPAWAIAASVPGAGAAQWLDVGVPNRPVADAASVEAGRAIYDEHCWFCHGNDGDGRGPVAPYLWPRPRDFTMGSFKFRTTQSGELPTDEDLFRSITLGFKGTAMPGWESTLDVEERWQVIAYIKTFADYLFEDEEFDPYLRIIEIGEPPRQPIDSLIAAGQSVYEEAECGTCHGALGRGDGDRAGEIDDDWGFPTLPADLDMAWKLKGGNSVREIFLRFSSGLDGTPMPSYRETLTETERWELAYYVAALVDPNRSEPSPGAVITAVRTDRTIPSGVDDPAWDGAAQLRIPLTGQATYAPRWQIPAVTDLTVQAIYNAEEIALRLSWNDRFADTLPADSARAQSEGWESDDTYPRLYPDGVRRRDMFPDAAEVLFPVHHGEGPILPHFVYGDPARPVDVWRWQADVASGSPVVEMRASGGSLPPEPHAPESQQVFGESAWRDGRWTVVVRRTLETDEGPRETQLRAGDYVPIAFHIREGANGETGLRMAQSSWYFVHLRQPTPTLSYLVVLLAVGAACGVEYGIVRWMRAGRPPDATGGSPYQL